jgi:hypothetical protein
MDVKVENLDHLGIVAGIIDKIGIVELIDEQVGQHSQQKVSTGQAVKAMILNRHLPDENPLFARLWSVLTKIWSPL